MARTQGVKRARADSPVSLGLANQTEETVDNAPPPAKRAARSSKGKAVADHDGSDYDCLGEDLEEEELAPEEIQALAIKGELVDFEEDSDDGDSESTWDEWDNELSQKMSRPPNRSRSMRTRFWMKLTSNAFGLGSDISS